MRFSDRVPGDLEANAIFQKLEERHGRLIDLTVSNPTVCGFDLGAIPFEALSSPSVRLYEPCSQGAPSAREAVMGDLSRQGLKVAVEDLFLTSGTSEAYAYVFKLMARPGDKILFPTPGYPLVEHLSQAEGLTQGAYRFRPGDQGRIDFASLEEAAEGQKVAAVVAIDPHNPLGHYLDEEDHRELDRWCAEHGAALVLDEVFWDYAWGPCPPPHPAFLRRALTFHMGGLSKTCALPQLKCAWTAFEGPKEAVEAARTRLDFLADLYLSVGTPVQAALGGILRSGENIRTQVLQRVRSNRSFLEGTAETSRGLWRVLKAEAGWASVLALEDPGDEEQWVLELLDQGLMIQPGYFFGMEEGARFVVSLLAREKEFREGIEIFSRYTRERR